MGDLVGVEGRRWPSKRRRKASSKSRYLQFADCARARADDSWRLRQVGLLHGFDGNFRLLKREREL